MKSFKQRLEGKDMSKRIYAVEPKTILLSQEDVLKAHEDYKKDLIKEIDNELLSYRDSKYTLGQLWKDKDQYDEYIKGLQKAKELIK